MNIIEPKEEISVFSSDENYREKLIEWGLITEKTKEPKRTFQYKGSYTTEPVDCCIVGYISTHSIVLEFEGEKRHAIHPSYLKNMQKKDFRVQLYAENE